MDNELRKKLANYGRSDAYVRGWHDGAWSTYRPNANDDRAEYDRGHAAGVAYRAARASEGSK